MGALMMCNWTVQHIYTSRCLLQYSTYIFYQQLLVAHQNELGCKTSLHWMSATSFNPFLASKFHCFAFQNLSRTCLHSVLHNEICLYFCYTTKIIKQNFSFFLISAKTLPVSKRLLSSILISFLERIFSRSIFFYYFC